MRSMALFSAPLAALVALASGVLFWGMQDAQAGISALIGGVLALMVFSVGLWAIKAVLGGPVGAAMAGAFAVLIVQLVIVAMIIVVLAKTDWVDLMILGVGFLVTGIVFQIGVVLGYVRSRRLVFDEPATDPSADASPGRPTDAPQGPVA